MVDAAGPAILVTAENEATVATTGSIGREAPWIAARRVFVRHWSSTVVWFGALVWGVAFALLAAGRHDVFLSHRFDLGNMVQAVWSTAHGDLLQVTTGPGQQMSRLGSHVDPLLAAFAPAWWLWPSPIMLTTVQAFALASGALPVFWLARKHTGDERVGLTLSFTYLLYPAVQFGALNDFHPVTLAVPLLLFMLWALDEDRLVLAGLCGVLAALSKEDVPLVIAGIGVWFAIRRGRPLVGGAIAALGVTTTVVDLRVVIPHFAGGSSPFYDRLDGVGGSPLGVVQTLFTDPGRILASVTTAADVKYLVVLLVPLVALWAFEPLLVLAAAPVLAINLLSDFVPMTMVRYQYTSGIVPCVFAAAAIGAGRLSRRSALIAATGTLGIVVLLSVTGPLGSLNGYGGTSRPSQEKVAALRRAVELVPAGVSVSVSNDLGGHLSERRTVYSFPLLRGAEWVAVNAAAWQGEANPVGEMTSPRRFSAAVDALARDPRYELVFSEEGVFVYRKRLR